VGGPSGTTSVRSSVPERGILRIRKELDLYANLRPARLYPDAHRQLAAQASVVEGADLLVIRELTGGSTSGSRGASRARGDARRGFNTMSYTAREIERIADLAFRVARGRRRA
jgi:3-isopropylmalate dehydrogenase